MTFSDWANYFSANQNHLDNLSWDDTYRLTERELRAIRYSLPQFQQGEHSEGKHLYQKAKDLGDPDYVAAIRLFIREEQGHARVLGQYMAIHQLPRLCKSSGLDKVFRWLRQWASLEHTLRVLLTAEIIAAVYYQALYQATYSGLLQQICRRILRDEEMHLNFQCFTLTQITRGQSALRRWATRQAYRTLMAGTTLVVWVTYHRTLRAGGFGLLAFADAVSVEFGRVEEMLAAPGGISVREQVVESTVSVKSSPTFQPTSVELQPL
ncbi:ferritin-like domain-containing protein [Hymenobacter radiodurans]|uniref:ferritin-like domain-containing protein n=1 Tax=Hymenobacter radiodurans TaxID=2496028 RepID=UPI001058A3DB|nr:ferritin-like domain-containing protein [Hymenobacter radiodurans]